MWFKNNDIRKNKILKLKVYNKLIIVENRNIFIKKYKLFSVCLF